jgi:nucleoside-diphosphate kinase
MKEISLVIIKPDCTKPALGEIFLRLEKTRLERSGLKTITATSEQWWQHYNKDEKWLLEKGTRIVKNIKQSGQPVEKEAMEYGRDIIKRLVEHLTSGPIIIMIYEGYNAVDIIKKIVGTTEPITSDPGTIRRDLGTDSFYKADLEKRALKNLIHCSDSKEEALREILVWFSEQELNRINLKEYFN